MMRVLAALFAGALFGLGLALSRMTDPTVILSFLDVSGDFDPTLAFVLGGAVAATALLFPLVMKQPRPIFDEAFKLPTATAIDKPLLIGAAIFGIGWGLAGYCPAPALVAAAAGVSSAWLFVPAMLAGALLHRLGQRYFKR